MKQILFIVLCCIIHESGTKTSHSVSTIDNDDRLRIFNGQQRDTIVINYTDNIPTSL